MYLTELPNTWRKTCQNERRIQNQHLQEINTLPSVTDRTNRKKKKINKNKGNPKHSNNPDMYESESRSVVSNSLQPHGLYSPRNSPGQNSGVGSLSVLQGIFPTQGLKPGLLYFRQILYHLSHQGRFFFS